MSHVVNRYSLVLDGIKTLDDIYVKKEQIIKLVEKFEQARRAVKRVSKSHQKSAGIYYTPDDLSEYLIENTLNTCLTRRMAEKWGCSARNMAEFLNNSTLEELSALEKELFTLRILDFSAGSGVFLVAAGNYLVNLYRKIQQKKVALGHRDSGYSMLELRKQIITKLLYGIDFEQEAVQICKLRLLLSLLAEFQPRSDNPSDFSIPLPDLDFNVFCGNSLIGFDGSSNQLGNKNPQESLKDLFPLFEQVSSMIDNYKNQDGVAAIKNKKEILTLIEKYSGELDGYYLNLLTEQTRKAPRDISEYQPFHWILFFPALLFDGGFDIIVGNPPYNANITPEALQLVNEIPSRGTLQSANLFIYKTFRLLRKYGCFGLVLPKSICYTANWEVTRELLIPKIEQITDVKKAFPGVLLEQILVVGNRENSLDPHILSSDIEPMKFGEVKSIEIPRSLILAAKKIYLNLNRTEIDIFTKVVSPRQFLGDLSSIERGFPWQKLVSEGKGIPILEGKNIRRNHITRTFLSLPESAITQESTGSATSTKIKKMAEEKILLQNIVAHISKPLPFIELCAVIDRQSFLGLDTVDNLFITEKPPEGVNQFSVTAFLNSSFASWFAYRFIYTKAIRTMHFDNVQLNRLPFRYVHSGTVDEGIKQAITSIKEGKLELATITYEVSVIRKKIALFDESKLTISLLLLITSLEEVLEELVGKVHDTWENILERMSEMLQLPQRLVFSKFKLRNSSKEHVIRKLRTDNNFKVIFGNLDQLQRETLEESLTAFFDELKRDRFTCLKLQQLVDDAVFDLFNLDKHEIEEIKNNYVLRSNL
ncbi:MAG: Eco57I restriction-modification methylase domain-containing protein [Candidatus Odinarchaeota archaeon]